MSLQVSRRFLKKLDALDPKHRGQVATKVLKLGADRPRPGMRKYRERGTQLMSAGEYRVEITRNGSEFEVTDLFKRNDNYKP